MWFIIMGTHSVTMGLNIKLTLASAASTEAAPVD